MIMVKKTGSVLESFKLDYEEMEKKVGKPNPKVKAKAQLKKPNIQLKARIKTLFARLRKLFNNVVNKAKPHRKSVKKVTKKQQKLNREQQMRGILGIGLLFVVVSITYSTYVIFNGVDSSASRLLLAPQVFFALYTLFKAFSKIYK